MPEDKLRELVLEFALNAGNDEIHNRFGTLMEEDGYFGNEDVECPFCGCVTTECPECYALHSHGEISNCPEQGCKEVNAPIQCVHCGRVVCKDLSGVLDFDMSLRKYT
jgi:hypothetical protein